MAKPEFLMLAQDYEEKKFLTAGNFMSEKLDGSRCFWDGGITTGMFKTDVPWANNALDERYLEPQRCTGLWSRYGNIVHAPPFFIEALPEFMLDGELYMGRGEFQTLRSVASKLPENRSDSAWRGVQYLAFDIPHPAAIFKARTVKLPKSNLIIPAGTLTWATPKLKIVPRTKAFRNVQLFLAKNLVQNDYVRHHKQIELPFSTEKALYALDVYLETITGLGGEGVMLRKADSEWLPERTWDLVKVKKLKDAEAKVVGYVTGRATEKGSKLRGLMGALVVEWKGQTFELSGFTDLERVLSGGDTLVSVLSLRKEMDEVKTTDFLVEPKAFQWCWDNPSPPNGPGTRVPDWISNPRFPRGSEVTFKYREETDDGLPKEARYWRVA